MTEQKFIEDFLDIMQREEAISMQTKLSEMPEWDSLTFMVVAAYADQKHGKEILLSQLRALTTVEELYCLLTQDKK